MRAFRYERPTTVEAAVEGLSVGGALLKASGIDLLDRMKERIDEPERVVTLVDVPGIDRIERVDAGGLRLGAMTTLAALAASEDVRTRCPTLAEAAGLAASPALRNRATLGGNLGQQTRCGYFRMKSFACWKRGDDLCPPREKGGVADNNGIFANAPCACAHPSSIAPVLGAVGATAIVLGPKGERRVPLGGLYAEPAQGKRSDLSIAPDEVIVRLDVPPIALGAAGGSKGPEHVGYAEIRQKQAFDWPLVSCAVWFVDGGAAIKEARVWLGSVAPSPWRSEAAEKALVGKSMSTAAAAAAGEAAVVGATPLAGNAYKVDLVKVAVRRALLSRWALEK